VTILPPRCAAPVASGHVRYHDAARARAHRPGAPSPCAQLRAVPGTLRRVLRTAAGDDRPSGGHRSRLRLGDQPRRARQPRPGARADRARARRDRPAPPGAPHLDRLDPRAAGHDHPRAAGPRRARDPRPARRPARGAPPRGRRGAVRPPPDRADPRHRTGAHRQPRGRAREHRGGRLPAAPPRITHHQPRHRGAGGQGEGRRGFRHHTGLLRALRLPRPALADPGRRDPDADRAGPRARHQPAPARAPRRDQRGRRSARAPAPPGDRVEQRRAPTDRSALHRRPRPSCARCRRARPAPVHLRLARRRPRRARPPGSGPPVPHPARRRPMTAQTPLPAATPVGYPRIGPDRELKKAEEAYWAGRIDHAEFARRTRDLRRATRARLAALGLDAAAAAPESFSLYDQVLDAALAVGIVPERFASVLDADGAVDDDGLFALARGTAEQPPLEMTKWFDTNYHYLVPEIGPDTDLHLASARAVDLFTESLEDGAGTRPVLVGPLTLLLLAKAQDGAPAGFDPLDRLDDVVAVYAQLLSRLAAAGAPWVQLDEPALAADQRIAPAALAELLQRSVGRLAAGSDRPQLLVTTPPGGGAGLLPALLATGAEAVHVDLTRGHLPTVGQLAGVDSVQLVAGLVEGRSVWRTELPTAAARLAELRRRVTEAGG